MKKLLFKISVAVYLLFLLLAIGTTSIPPHDLPIYLIMFVSSLLAYILGREMSKGWRVACAIAIFISTCGAFLQVAAAIKLATH
jgi:hypothetical protein